MRPRGATVECCYYPILQAADSTSEGQRIPDRSGERMSPRTRDQRSEQAPTRILAAPPLAFNVAGSSLLRCLLHQWEPERPELLIRLRPRTEECRVPR